jgi:hypothetical protein
MSLANQLAATSLLQNESTTFKCAVKIYKKKRAFQEN